MPPVIALPEPGTSKRRRAWIAAGLFLLVAIAFEPVRHNEFVEYDDNQYLTENTHIRSGFSRESVGWAFTSGYAANWHPLTWLSHMADIELFGVKPAGHHLHNVLLHALATMLLFLILENMTGAVWRSAFVAMAFGIHPLRVESVAWAAERKDVLCAVFWMLTIAAYLDYVKRGGARRYLLVGLCFALGLMTKPMLVSLPLVLLVLDFWPLGRVRQLPLKPAQPGRAVSLPRLIAEKIPLLMLAAVSCAITYHFQQQGKSMAPDLPLPFRVANALTSGVGYLGKIFWPGNLAVLYPYPVEWPLWKPAAAALILVACSALVRSRWSSQPYLAAGWSWYLISLVPVIGLVQVGAQSMADRYTCLPSIGIFIMLAWTATRLSAGWRRQRLILALLGSLAAIAMVAATRTQLSYWKNSLALFDHTVAVTRNNYVMHHSLGWVLAKQDQLDEAADHFRQALQLHPDPDTNLDLADLLIRRKQFDEAVTYLNRVLQVEPTNAIAHYDLGVVFQAREKVDEAIDAYEQAVRLDRDNSRAYNNLGILKTEKGLLDEAAECFRQSLRGNPDKAETHRNFAVVLQMQDRAGEAVAHYRVALQIDPHDDRASWSLAYALHGLGRLREAADYDRYTLRLQPDHPRALNDLAWILATTPDRDIQNPAEAISLARKACELTAFKDPDLLDTLAAAQAGARQFNDAIETARKAMDLAKAAGQEELAQAIGTRLQLYQASEPYYEPPPENRSPAPTSQKP